MKAIAVILCLLCVLAAFQPAPTLAANAKTPLWHTWGEPAAPASRPSGEPFLVTFINRQHKPVKIYWLSPAGERKFYYEVLPGADRRQKLRKDAVWIVTDARDEPLGYFVFGEPTAQAVIPHP